jgi:hypothetical protein
MLVLLPCSFKFFKHMTVFETYDILHITWQPANPCSRQYVKIPSSGSLFFTMNFPFAPADHPLELPIIDGCLEDR